MWPLRKWVMFVAATVAACAWAFALGSMMVEPSTLVTNVVSNVKPISNVKPEPCNPSWDCTDNDPCKNDANCLGECECLEEQCVPQ